MFLRTFTITSCIVVSLLAMSCTSNSIAPVPGEVVTETRRVGSFRSLSVERGLRAEVVVDQSDSITLNVSEGFLPYIRTVVEGSTLRIFVDENVDVRGLAGNGITVTAPRLDVVSASGASTIECFDVLEAETMAVNSSGASRIFCGLQATQLNVSASGASTIDLNGNTRTLNAGCSGASTLFAFELDASDVSINASGASSAEVQAQFTLFARASGASLILYRGNPRVEQSATGGSEVRRVN